jgi:hypothetical protein
MRKNIIITIILTVGVIGVVGVTLASFYFYNVAVARSEKEFMTNNNDLRDVNAFSFSNEHNINWVDVQGYDDVYLESHDGLSLHGYWIQNVNPTNKTVILAHGYSSNGKGMANLGKFFYEELGFNVLLPDNRGHGQSEGDFIGFGWVDRLDYLKWIDHVIDKLGEESEIILHGISMGGSTVLMTSGEHLPKQVKAIISDCAYTSVKDELTYQLERMYKLPSFPIIETTSLLTKVRAGYYFGEASALKQVAKTEVPILYIHGDADVFVPYDMVYELYEATPSEKEVFIVEGAGHAVAFNKNPDGYKRAVINFVDQYIPLETGK